MTAEPRVERVETRIADIAAAHVRRFGLRKLTVVGVAEAAGMSHANVYRYFASKAALVDAVTAHWLAPLEASLRSTAEGPDPAIDKLERLLATLYRAYRDKLEGDPQIFGLLCDALRQERPVARKHRGKVQLDLRRTIEQGASSGQFLSRDARRIHFFVEDAMHRFIEPRALESDVGLQRPLLDQRFDQVLRVLSRNVRLGRDE